MVYFFLLPGGLPGSYVIEASNIESFSPVLKLTEFRKR
jgi:hypothetical protein